MMNQWVAYVRERFGDEVIEEEWGFCTYRIILPFIAFNNLYVKPEFRRGIKGFQFLNSVIRIGKAAGATHIWTEVSLKDSGADKAVRCNLACKFKMITAHNDAIIFQREIGG
jgi:hypothetical protein